MKKIIMLLALVFILTGCSANVNLTVTSNNIEEEIIINAYSDSDTTKEQINSSFRKYMPVFMNVPLSDTEPDTKKNGIEYYDRRIQDLGSGYKFTYKYKYKFEDYKNAKSVGLGFNSKTIHKSTSDKRIMISTDSSGLKYFNQYPNLETVTINIKCTYKSIENNADYINGNVYTWVLHKGTKKSIYLLVEDSNMTDSSVQGNGTDGNGNTTNKPVIDMREEKEESKFIKFVNKYPVIVAIGGILAFFIILFVVIKIGKIK